MSIRVTAASDEVEEEEDDEDEEEEDEKEENVGAECAFACSRAHWKFLEARYRFIPSVIEP
jgi:hypothetical protein